MLTSLLNCAFHHGISRLMLPTEFRSYSIPSRESSAASCIVGMIMSYVVSPAMMSLDISLYILYEY